MSRMGIEPMISAFEQMKMVYTLDSIATVISRLEYTQH
jgi:hypothetical protein